MDIGLVMGNVDSNFLFLILIKMLIIKLINVLN